MGRSRRGNCSECARERAVTRAGVVRTHWIKGQAPAPFQKVCPGTGKPPKAAGA